MSIRILGTGSYLPPKVVTNDDIAKSLETTDEWIYSHTGIHARHIAGEGETTSTMAIKAAKQALEAASTKPEEIGLIVVATSTPDYYMFPSTACLVQAGLGCTDSGAYDLQAACAGFVYALEQARGFLTLHPGKKALVIGAESLTRLVDWTDRSSCILFGDGAGAIVLGEETTPEKAQPLVNSILGADGTGGHLITCTGGTREAPPFDPVSGVPSDAAAIQSQMILQGHEVFAFAVRKLAKVVSDLCANQGLAPDELDRIFAHQANSRIIEATARRMKLPLDKFWLNLETTANTSAASIPISLDQAVRGGALKDGMKIILVGFGAGLTYGGTYLQWPCL